MLLTVQAVDGDARNHARQNRMRSHAAMRAAVGPLYEVVGVIGAVDVYFVRLVAASASDGQARRLM